MLILGLGRRYQLYGGLGGRFCNIGVWGQIFVIVVWAYFGLIGVWSSIFVILMPLGLQISMILWSGVHVGPIGFLVSRLNTLHIGVWGLILVTLMSRA